MSEDTKSELFLILSFVAFYVVSFFLRKHLGLDVRVMMNPLFPF